MGLPIITDSIGILMKTEVNADSYHGLTLLACTWRVTDPKP